MKERQDLFSQTLVTLKIGMLIVYHSIKVWGLRAKSRKREAINNRAGNVINCTLRKLLLKNIIK